MAVRSCLDSRHKAHDEHAACLNELPSLNLLPFTLPSLDYRKHRLPY